MSKKKTAQEKYIQSDKGKKAKAEASKTYAETATGQAKIQKAQEKYEQTEKGKALIK